ncbi:MAG TPA: hemerythrin domain-containing protein [Polyangiales bacterium]
MKATTLLEQQHRKVKTLFKKLESGRSEAAPLLEELANDLIAHMVIEHELFYPAVQAIDRDLVTESFEEHSLAELALKRLLATDPSDESFKARVVATKELIEHHVKEEEEELFPKVEKKLGAEKLEQLGKQMKTRFQQAKDEGFEGFVSRTFARTLADREKKLALGRPKKRAA